MSEPKNVNSKLSPEIQQQLTVLTTQLKAAKVSESLQKELKKAISTLIMENIAFKRENVQLRTKKDSKS